MPLCSELMSRPKKAVAGSRPERTTPGGSSRAGRGRQYCKLRWLLSPVIGIFQCIFELKMPRPVIWQRFTSTNACCHEPPLSAAARRTVRHGHYLNHGRNAVTAPARDVDPRRVWRDIDGLHVRSSGMWGGRSRERPTQTPHRAIRSRPADVTVAVEVAVVTTPHVVTSLRIARARARMT